MRKVLPSVAAFLMVALCASLPAAVQQNAKKAKKKGYHQSAAQKRPPAKTATATHKSAGAAQARAANKSRTGMAKAHPQPNGKASTARKTKKGTRKTATTWRNRQMAPTSDRYRDIQSALAAKGYLKAEDANGQWNQSSIDALKKFQSEQNLEATGKLNALSLIALGLGPKYDTRASVVPRGLVAAQSAN